MAGRGKPLKTVNTTLVTPPVTRLKPGVNKRVSRRSFFGGDKFFVYS
jgi:hypothetical protein